ncbi:hypothetical protein ACYOEI_18535 [Singulisphaera rosea]
MAEPNDDAQEGHADQDRGRLCDPISDLCVGVGRRLEILRRGMSGGPSCMWPPEATGHNVQDARKALPTESLHECFHLPALG